MFQEWPIDCCYLHWAFVHPHAVELNQGVVGAARLTKDDSGNPPTDSSWTIGQGDSTNMSNHFVEIFLKAKMQSTKSVHWDSVEIFQ